ncbi:hypothetical protein, partial [Escherichia coli]
EWVHVQLHQQKGMISLSPPTICNSAAILILSLMEKLSPLSDPLLYGSIVKTPEGKNLYMVVPMSIIARLTILFVL